MLPEACATSLCGGPGMKTTSSTSPTRSVVSTVRTTELRLVVSMILQGSEGDPPTLPFPPPPPTSRSFLSGGGFGSGRQSPPPPPPDMIHLLNENRLLRIARAPRS